MKQYATLLKTKAVWAFILAYATDPQNEARVPTYREIMAGVGISSTSVCTYYMREIEKRGLIRFRFVGGGYTIAGARLIAPATEFALPAEYEY